MALAGTLETMAVAELLQYMGPAQRSGVLRLDSEGRRRLLLLTRGDVRAVGSDPPIDLVGPTLIAQSGLPERDMREAFDIARRSGHSVGDVLAATCRMPDGELQRMLGEKAVGWACEPIAWKRGSFEFREGEDLPGGPIATVELPWRDMALAAPEWEQRLSALEGRLPGLDVAYTPTSRAIVQSCRTEVEEKVLALASAGFSGREICSRLAAADIEGLEALVALLQRGVIGVGRVAAPRACGPSTAIRRGEDLAARGRACEAMVLLARAADIQPGDAAIAAASRSIAPRVWAEGAALMGDLELVPDFAFHRGAPNATLSLRRESSALALVNGWRSVRCIVDAQLDEDAKALALAVLASLFRSGGLILRPSPVAPASAPVMAPVVMGSAIDEAAHGTRIGPRPRNGPRQELEAAPAARDARRVGSR